MSDEPFIDTDDNGAPIMLAVRKPGQVAAQPDSSGAVLYRGARSGNANFDPITGKFAGKKLRGLEVVAQTVAGRRSHVSLGHPIWSRSAGVGAPPGRRA